MLVLQDPSKVRDVYYLLPTFLTALSPRTSAA